MASVLLLAAGCQPPRPVLQGIFTGSGNTLTIVIDDGVGWIRGFEFVTAEHGPYTNGLSLTNPGGKTTVVRVGWAGGGCEQTATLALTAGSAERLQLVLTSRPTCEDQMAVYRTVDLVFDRDVAAAPIDGYNAEWATPPP